jgi:outer membrane protein assembly factor BamB
MIGAPTLLAWWDTALPLVIGVCGVTFVVAAIAAAIRHAAWERTLWQAAVLGILAILAVEVTGATHAVSRRLRMPPAGFPERSLAAQDGISKDGRGSAPTAPVVQMEGRDTLQVTHRRVTTAPDAVLTPAAASGTEAIAVEPPGSDPGTWWPGLVWLGGTGALAMRWIAAQVMLALFLRRRTRPPEGHVQERAQSIAARLSFGSTIRIRDASGIASPFAVGVLRPTVIVPEGFTRDFEPLEQDAVLAHEIGHLAGRDGAWRTAADLVTALLWWHPGAWYVRRRLITASETAADEASLAVRSGPGALADGLVRIARRISTKSWLAVPPRASGSGLRSGLARRVERLLSLGDVPWRDPRRLSLRAVRSLLPPFAASVFVLACAVFFPRAGATPAHALDSVRVALAGLLGASVDSAGPSKPPEVSPAAADPGDAPAGKAAAETEGPRAGTDLLKDVPPAIRDTIEKLSRGGKLSAFERRENPLETLYRAAIDKGGAQVLFVISPEGDVVEFQVLGTGDRSNAERDRGETLPSGKRKDAVSPEGDYAGAPLDEWTQSNGSADHNRFRRLRDTIQCPRVLWHLPEQSGVPAVYRGMVYAPGRSLVLARLDDGQVLARVAAGDRGKDGSGEEGSPGEQVLFQGTPVVAGDRVIAVKSTGAVDAWSLDLRDRKWSAAPAGSDSWGAFSPAAHGRVLVMANGPVVALSIDDGRELWRFDPPEGRVELAPAIADRAVFFATRMGTLYALELDTGAVRWKQFSDSQFGWSDPLVVGGRLFICDRGAPNRRGALNAFDASSGKHVWTGEFGATGSSTPAVGHGYVYIGFGRYVGFYDRETGTIDRSRLFRTGINPFGSPTLVGESLIFGNLDGFLYVFDFSSGKLRWRFTPRASRSGDEKTQVHGFAYLRPGIILVTSTEGLFAIGQDPAKATCPDGFILTPAAEKTAPAKTGEDH